MILQLSCLYVEQLSYEHGKIDMPWSSKLYSQAKDSKLYHFLKDLAFLDQSTTGKEGWEQFLLLITVKKKKKKSFMVPWNFA